MDLELAGRTAVVIGGSSGIGAAVAGVLSEEGCDVAVTYRRSRGGAEQAVAEARGHGRRAWGVPLELGAPGSVAGAAETLADQVGGLDVVVLCAGHNVVTPFGQVSAVAPGITLTPMGENTIGNLAEDYAETSLLLQRFATPRRVAQLIALVASPVAEFMTGVTVDVNSGRFLP